MPRNGSGTYSLPSPENPIIVGSESSATSMNTTLTDVGTALTNSLTANGEKTATANQPMGNFVHTGVGNATARTNYAAAAQIQDGSLIRLGTVAGTNTITAALTPAITAYANGQMFTFIAAGANTGAATINVNSVGAKAIVKQVASGYVALTTGDIISGLTYIVIYDDAGTDQFVLVNPTSVSQFNGSYTASATGLSTVPTGTIYYRVVGNVVHLECRGAGWTGTSNSTAFTLTGAPAEIRPASASGNIATRVTDNGTTQSGTISMETDGTLTILRISSPSFTTSGTKTISAFSGSYMLSLPS